MPRVQLCHIFSVRRGNTVGRRGGSAALWMWSRSKRDALDLMRLDHAWFTRLRLVDTAIQAVCLACRSPSTGTLVRRNSPPVSQVSTCPCPVALRLKVALRSVSPAGETDLIPMSRVLRDPQAAKFSWAQILLQTSEPEQCAHTRQAHPGSVGIYPTSSEPTTRYGDGSAAGRPLGF